MNQGHIHPMSVQIMKIQASNAEHLRYFDFFSYPILNIHKLNYSMDPLLSSLYELLISFVPPLINTASDVYEVMTFNHPLPNSPSLQLINEHLVREKIVEQLEEIVEDQDPA